jgi:hypothetical protein
LALAVSDTAPLLATKPTDRTGSPLLEMPVSQSSAGSPRFSGGIGNCEPPIYWCRD